MSMPDRILDPLNRVVVRPSWLGRLPMRLLAPLAQAPFLVQRGVLLRLLAHLFKEPLGQGEFDFLQGRWLEVACDELKLRWFFSCTPQRTIIMQNDAIADVVIRGSFKGLVELAAQRVDPDTLFFQRELVIEGDTELGLRIKNLLDRVDTETWPPELLFAMRGVSEWISLFGRV